MSLFISLLLACTHADSVKQTAGFISVKEILVKCEKDSNEDCTVGAVNASGSATRVVWKNDYYWLTAAHVCDPVAGAGIQNIARNITVTPGGAGATEEIQQVTLHKESDLCLMRATPGPARHIAVTQPRQGANVFIIAYPGGAFSQDALPIYEGRFSGMFSDMCVTTIPVAGGASGAGVIDRNGNLAGVISAVMREFNHFSIAVCLSKVQEFLGQAALQNKPVSAQDAQTAQPRLQEPEQTQRSGQ